MDCREDQKMEDKKNNEVLIRDNDNKEMDVNNDKHDNNNNNKKVGDNDNVLENNMNMKHKVYIKKNTLANKRSKDINKKNYNKDNCNNDNTNVNKDEPNDQYQPQPQSCNTNTLYPSTSFSQYPPYWLQPPFFFPSFPLFQYPNYPQMPSQYQSNSQNNFIQSQTQNTTGLTSIEEKEIELMQIKIKLSNVEIENSVLQDKIKQMKETIKENKSNNAPAHHHIAKLKESKSKILYLKEKNEKYFIEINQLNDIINETKQQLNTVLNKLKDKSNQLAKLINERDRRTAEVSMIKKENESYKANMQKIENENFRLYDQIDKNERYLHELKKKVIESDNKYMSMKQSYESLSSKYHKLREDNSELIKEYNCAKEDNELMIKELSKIALNNKRKKKSMLKKYSTSQSQNFNLCFNDYFDKKNNDDYNLQTPNTNPDDNCHDTSIGSTYESKSFDNKRNLVRKPSFSMEYDATKNERNEKLIEEYEIKLIELTQLKGDLKHSLIQCKRNDKDRRHNKEKNIQREVIAIDDKIDKYTQLINNLAKENQY